MTGVITWCGFFGAWLLVASPVFQAALELREEDLEREHLHRAATAVGEPPEVSPWWWLLPPVHYVMSRRRSREFRTAVFEQLTVEQRAALVSYMNKATGWLYVGAGGLLIAVKETGELVEHHEWPSWLLWVLVVVMAFLAVSNTAARMRRGQEMSDRRR